MKGLWRAKALMLSIVFSFIPRPWLYRLGDLWGTALFKWSPLGRQVVRNMTDVFGERMSASEVLRHAEAVFRNQAKVNLEYYLFSRMTLQRLGDLVKVEGISHVDQALSQGRGVIVFSLHMGNMNLAQALALRGYPVSILRGARKRRSKEMPIGTQLSRRVLSRDVIPANRLREMYRCLERKEVVGFMLDGLVGGRYDAVPFLGKPMAFSDGMVRLASRTGAALVPIVALRLPDNRVRLLFHRPIEITEGEDRGPSLRETLRRCLAVFEPFLYADPGQWLKWTDYHVRQQLLDDAQSEGDRERGK